MARKMMVLAGVVWGLVAVVDMCHAETIYVSGDVSGTWSADTVIVQGDIYVPPGDTLIIEPGVEVRFDQDTGLTVAGVLLAEGTVGDSIIFTSNLPIPEMGDWSGIIFTGNTSCDMDYCTVEYGVIGATAPYPFGAEMNLFRCALSGVSGTVKTAVIDECIINGGVSGYPGNSGHGSMTIDNCQVYGNISCSSYDSELSITNNTVYGNLNAAVGYMGIIYNIHNNTLNNGGISFSHDTETVGTLGGNIINNAPGNGITIDLNWGPISGGTGTSGNTINGAVGDGINITTDADPTSGVSAGGNNIFNVVGRGIYVRRENMGGWSYNASVGGNTIESCGQEAVVVENFNNISVTNNSITGSGSEAIKISNPYNGYNGVDINVEQNTIDGSIQGILISQPNSTEEQTTITINSNSITDIDSVGISISNIEEDSLNLFITHNVITVGEPYSVMITNAHSIEIINNTISGGGLGITNSVPGNNYAGISNNIISSGLEYGVFLSGIDLADVTYNDVWNFTLGNYSGVTPGPGSISIDPQLVDPQNGDFSLQRVSPCIDAGSPTSPLDPDGTRADMGALYFHQDMPVKLTLTPENPPIVIPATGGEFNFNIEVTNRMAEPQTFDLWTEIELPGWGSVEIMSVTGLSVAVGDTVDRDRTQQVPDFAPEGTYTYLGYVGTYPWIVDDYYHFYFDKESSDYGGSLGLPSDWLCSGEPFTIEIAEINIPKTYALHDPYPNPFNPTTTIRFELSVASFVKIEVFDIAGRTVGAGLKPAPTTGSWYHPGIHQISFDGSALSSGIYIYRLEAKPSLSGQAGEFTATGKMVLMK